jgi:hypothetical protein
MPITISRRARRSSTREGEFPVLAHFSAELRGTVGIQSGPHLEYLMVSFDQIQCELKAVVEFDALFLASADRYPDELDGHECRVLRKIELLELARHIAARN